MAGMEKQLPAIEVARQLAELGDIETAVKAYEDALTDQNLQPMDRLEAACAVLQYGGEYTRAYDAFLELYKEEQLCGDVMDILTQAFYMPNVNRQKNLYKKNCKLLKKYPYIFRKDFVPFEELPVLFYPYDDNGVLPFRKDEKRFDAYINVNDPQVTHYFFRDLEKPVFASDIFSQYELEYLKDNVRRSDWIARENHIYLHYTNWGEFCAYLALLDMKALLEDEKFVFLIEEEQELYPIDFKERFGIDYSTCPVKPIGIREINKLIWHTQLHAHNGGDFFNEILHEHPNIYAGDTLMFYTHLDAGRNIIAGAEYIRENGGTVDWPDALKERLGEDVLRELQSLEDVTLKDAFVALYLRHPLFAAHISAAERIVPAFFFQPHFHHIGSKWELHESGALALTTEVYQELLESGIFNQFKYIKTFTPLRRPTTSHGASIRFMSSPHSRAATLADMAEEGPVFTSDDLINRLINRSFMCAESDRAFADSRIVRFEDAKLNPKATFTALAEFLDVPYTESMTYCSNMEGRDPLNIGFSTAAVYRTYDEYCDQYERVLIEYILRDVYDVYGYGYEHYDGKPMTQEKLEELVERADCGLEWVRKSWWENREILGRQYQLEGDELDKKIEELSLEAIKKAKERRLLTVKILSYNLPFCNEKGERLRFMKQLELNPDLLEQSLYR